MSAWILKLGLVDERLLRAVVGRRRPNLDLLMGVLTRLGDWWCVTGVAIALALGGAPGLESQGIEALGTLALSHLLVQLLKRRVGRPRPRLPVGMTSLVQAPDRFSFPSGHAAATLPVALPLVTGALGVFPAAVVLALALLVGFSRCYLGVHYPGDVLTGWILALGAYLVLPALPFFMS